MGTKLMPTTILQWLQYVKQSRSKHKQQQTSPFASERPCHFLDLSNRSHVLHMSLHDHQCWCQQYQQQCLLGDSSFFYTAMSIFGCFWCATHCCDHLTKAVGCRWAVLYFGLTKLAKNANIWKKCMLRLIHQDPYNLRYMVVQMLGLLLLRLSSGLVLNPRRMMSRK